MRCNEIDDSQRGHEAMNTGFEGSAVLETVTRQRLVKTEDCSELQSV
jgi:hypothetical protein